MSKMRGAALAFSTLVATPAPLVAASLTVGGTGSADAIVGLLFEAFRQESAEDTLNQVRPPLGSQGALQALALGRIDLAVVGRPPTPEESRVLGEQFNLADTPFVIASSTGKRPGGFTLDELASVYEGRLTAWDDGKPIRLVLRGSSESDTLTLRAMSPAMDQAVGAASRRPGMVVADNDLANLELLARTPGTLGGTTMGLLESTGTDLQLFPIDGRVPKIDGAPHPGYPWWKRLTVVLPAEPGPVAQRFVAFLRSAKASGVLKAHGYRPTAP